MIEHFKTFFNFLIHPIWATEHERSMRTGEGVRRDALFSVPMGIPLKLLLSWPFKMIETAYLFFALSLGAIYAKTWAEDLPLDLGIELSLTPLLIYTLLGVVFFPLKEWVEIKVWEYMIWMGLHIFKGKAPPTSTIGEDIAFSLSNNVFRAIPILGPLAAEWGKFVSMGVVMVKGHQLTFLQACVVLLMPMLLLGLVLVLFFLSLSSLFIL